MKTPQPHERRDISARGFAVLVGSYLGLVVVGTLVAYGVQRWLLGRFHKSDQALSPVVNELPPEPRLESDNGAELAKLRSWEAQVLSNYAWINRKAGLARIPLDRAIDLALAQGFPVERARP